MSVSPGSQYLGHYVFMVVCVCMCVYKHILVNGMTQEQDSLEMSHLQINSVEQMI